MTSSSSRGRRGSTIHHRFLSQKLIVKENLEIRSTNVITRVPETTTRFYCYRLKIGVHFKRDARGSPSSTCELVEAMIESAGSIGMVERYHAPLDLHRNEFERIPIEVGAINSVWN